MSKKQPMDWPCTIISLIMVLVISIAAFLIFSTCDRTDFAVGATEECKAEETELGYCPADSPFEGVWQVTQITQEICDRENRCETWIYTPERAYFLGKNRVGWHPCESNFGGYFSFTPTDKNPYSGIVSSLTFFKPDCQNRVTSEHQRIGRYHYNPESSLILLQTGDRPEWYTLEIPRADLMRLVLQLGNHRVKKTFELKKVGAVGDCISASPYFGNCYKGEENKRLLISGCITQKMCYKLLDQLNQEGFWEPNSR